MGRRHREEVIQRDLRGDQISKGFQIGVEGVQGLEFEIGRYEEELAAGRLEPEET